MTEVDQVTALNEEIQYHTERICQLETQLKECEELLRWWWAMSDQSGTDINIAIVNKLREATQERLTKLAKGIV